MFIRLQYHKLRNYPCRRFSPSGFLVRDVDQVMQPLPQSGEERGEVLEQMQRRFGVTTCVEAHDFPPK